MSNLPIGDIRAYRERWEAVEVEERREQQGYSPALRLKKLNSLIKLAHGMGLNTTSDEAEIEIVRQRWVQLKIRYEQFI